MKTTCFLLALSLATLAGCAATSDASTEDDDAAQSEDAFKRGDVYVLKGEYKRGAEVAGQGYLAVLSEQARTEGLDLVFDVQVLHPSLDGNGVVTKTFWGVRFVNEGVTYNLSEWRPLKQLKADGINYDIAFTFKNDGFVRDVFKEKLTRAEVTVWRGKQSITMSRDTR